MRSSRLTPLQWGLLGVTAAIIAAAISVAALHLNLLVQFYETSTSSLSSIARSARDLLRL